MLRSEYGVSSGDMEILDTKMIVLGEGMPARMAWKVRSSESFHFETESDECGLYAEIDEELNRYRSQRLPAIILIPGVSGNTGRGIAEVKRSVEQAVGSDIIFGNDN